MPSSRDSMLETARVLAEAATTDELEGVRATLEYLYHSGRDLTPSTLQSSVPYDLPKAAAENIIYQLDVEGILSDGYLNENELRTAFACAELLSTERSPPPNTVVATIPYDDPALDQALFEPLLSHTIELIQSATDHLLLMSPFLSEEAYERLRPALHTAAGSGATIELITRYLTYGDEDYNRSFVRRLGSDPQLSNVVTFFEYINEETWTTFHAKVIIADGTAAYLGTANITHRGLADNLELGVIFRDETAALLDSLMTALESSAFLHEVELQGGDFLRV